MTPPTPIAAMPVPEGLIVLLREKTRSIDGECARFLVEDNAEVLHDLRVAMRRLHSLFAGFSRCFSKENSLPKQLRALQKTTNQARDIEVTLALVEKLQLELPQLQQQWEEQLEGEYQLLRESIPPAWTALSAEFAQPQELLAGNLPDISLGAYASTLAAAEIKKVNRGMRSLGNKWSTQRAHKLRIRGKQIRYLLEPFVEESKATATAVAQLKHFQDLLGDYHDIFVLRQKLSRLRPDDSLPQITPLKPASIRLKKTQRQLRKTFLREYRGKKGRQLREAIREACQSLAHT